MSDERFGDRCDHVTTGLGTATLACVFAYGHNGWHRASDGTEWLPASDGGVWAHIGHDMQPYVNGVYPNELEALRAMNGDGHGSVIFLPWGTSVTDAEKAARSNPHPS